MLKRFYEEYFYHETVPDQPKSQVTIWEIAVLLAIVAAGIILSIIILLAEKKINFLQKITTVKGTRGGKINSYGSSIKGFNLKNGKISTNQYNLSAAPDVKFIRKNHEYKIFLTPGVNKISFEF